MILLSVLVFLVIKINYFDISQLPIIDSNPLYRILDFNTFVSKLDVYRFLQNNTILLCNCEGSEFIGQHQKHVLISNLKIMRDSKLRKVIHKGTKYQENNTISSKIVKLDIVAGINDSIETSCTKNGCEKSYLMNGNQK